MKRKSTLAIIIMAMFFAVTASSSDNDMKISDDKSATDSSEAAISGQSKIIAYYFHTTRRCSSCRKIEAYSDEAIKSGFQNELGGGRLIWLPVNTDEEENKHFVDDFELYTKSLILVEMNDEGMVRWKNLDKIWLLLNDKQKFIDYVDSEIREFMKGT